MTATISTRIKRTPIFAENCWLKANYIFEMLHIFGMLHYYLWNVTLLTSMSSLELHAIFRHIFISAKDNLKVIVLSSLFSFNHWFILLLELAYLIKQSLGSVAMALFTFDFNFAKRYMFIAKMTIGFAQKPFYFSACL